MNSWETALVIRGHVVPVEVDDSAWISGSWALYRVPGESAWIAFRSLDDALFMIHYALNRPERDELLSHFPLA